MRLSNYAFVVSIAVLAAFSANAADNRPPPLPAAPQVTVGANLRELIFDWDRVPGATYYELLANPDGHSGFTSINGQIAASRTRAGVAVSVHLQHWASARYIVAACNAAGCRNSVPLSVSDQMLDTIGYLKASNTNTGDRFGSGLALSSDGYTLAVAAPQESSNATGVNGDQANNSSPGSGAVYLFRRQGRSWHQEAYIKAAVNQPEQYFGYGYPFGQEALAINGNGSLLAVGTPGESVNGVIRAGKVYLYGRAATGSWTLQSTLIAPIVQNNDYFGISVDISVDGLTLKVNSIQPQDGEGNPEVRTHIFTRTGSTWALQTTIAPPVPGEFCQTVRMSGDGNTLVSACWGYVGTPSRLVTNKRNGNAWTQAPDVPTPSARTLVPLALNFNASRMAFTDNASLNSVVRTYAWSGTRWVAQAVIATPVPVIDINVFGSALAFNRGGNLLAIGDIVSGAAGAGVSETATGSSADEGAVFVYERGSAATWALRSVVKAPNPSIENRVGAWVALSGSGLTLAVGAPYEDSAATGVDGDRTDMSASSAGAVFLY